MNLSSFVVNTKRLGKRNDLILSTVNPILEIAKDVKPKPEIYKLYDYTKGGTDIVDQPKSKRWTVVAFLYLLDTSRIYNYGTNQVLLFVEHQSRNGLTVNIVQKINFWASSA